VVLFFNSQISTDNSLQTLPVAFELYVLPDDTKLGRKKPLGENHSIWLLTVYGLPTNTARSGVNKFEHSR